ncbi:ATP-binding protein [Parvibacter caecicola]|uniref:ATP-binding protein n=1 Tax=Parvibacter caecicola TaxID=747645 RepID=UPI00248B5FEB|nr:AAA family ATPase [Parvibacter caecicola]
MSTPLLPDALARAPYLKFASLVRFGAMARKVVGPFSPGLNVVFGPNEAGKSTLAAFVGGVLFGWEDARGRRNTYKPEDGERAGSLLFASRQATAEDEVSLTELSRKRNSDGLQGDAALVADIDKETFRTIFSLNSDELRSLRSTPDITAKLLTAGSGTGSSPAVALRQVNDQLAEYTSRSTGCPHSLVRLAEERAQLRAQVQKAGEEAERLCGQERQLRELQPQRDGLAERLAKLNRQTDTLTAAVAALARVEQEQEAIAQEKAQLEAERSAAARAYQEKEALVGSTLAHLSAPEERQLRETVARLQSRRQRLAQSTDLARDHYSASKAAYDALREAQGLGASAGDEPAGRSRAERQKLLRAALPVALLAIILVCGVALLMRGYAVHAFSFMALGVALVAFALIMTVAAFILIMRPGPQVDIAVKLEDARWVMVQDQKKLESCRADERANEEEAVLQLEEAGLEEAGGSLSGALALLDEARQVRAEMTLDLQTRKAAMARISDLRQREQQLAQEAAEHRRRAEVALDMPLEEMRDELARRTANREGLQETANSLNAQYGQLKEVLAQGRRAHDFDQLKLQLQEVETRIKDSNREFARLLLARRMLEGAITRWESKSQPEVYRMAGRFLALMTDGRWVSVSPTPEGELQVTNSLMETCNVLQLSLGTCQQLYLAMRIALLIVADNVGASVPVLADDILVNFDAKRRAGAARALAELARHRQVIVMTCHQEVADALIAADPTATQLNL